MATRASDDLERVLEEIEAAARREAEGSGEFADPGPSDVVLWGAGRLGRKTLAGLRRLGRDVVAFADTAERLHGTTVDGVPVLSPAEAARRHREARFVVTIWSLGGERSPYGPVAALAGLGVSRVETFAALFRRHPGVFLPHHRVDSLRPLADAAPALRAVFRRLADNGSRRELLAQLRLLADPGLDPRLLPPASPPPTYFPADLFRVSAAERFVDAGAYDGDTLRSLLGLLPSGPERAWAFEPDPSSHARLGAWLGSVPGGLSARVELRQAALSDRVGWASFEGDGSVGSSMSPGGRDSVPCLTLDEALGDERVTFVKMDVEGAELAALDGGSGVLRRDAPILAVCVYHLQSHLWEVPLSVSAISPEYRLYLRRYEGPPVDVVCYAVPPGRLLPGAAA